jgi:site-specific recombinase XerD
MGNVKVRHLIERLRSDGSIRYYWMPTAKLKAAGFLPRRLDDDKAKAVGQAEQLNADLDRWYAGAGQAKPQIEDLPTLDDLFQRNDEFKDLGERSQRDYLYNIKAANETFTGGPVKSLTTKVVNAWYQDQRKTFGISTSRNRMAALRRLLSFGRRIGWITENPALGMKIKAPESRSRIWTSGELDAMVKAAIGVGRPSMATAIMLGWCLGQRPADLRKLPWSSYDGRSIALRQAKTAAFVDVPALPELRSVLDTAPRLSPLIVVSEVTKRPYQESDFQHLFAEIRDGAGLPSDLQFRDLRRTMATALGRAGCTQDQIKAITGHKTRAVLDVYVRPDTSMAKGAIARLRRHR